MEMNEVENSRFNVSEVVHTFNIGSAGMSDRDSCVSLHEKKSNRDAYSKNVTDS